MPSLLNSHRSPAFCPGCSYDRIVRALDRALCGIGVESSQVVLVTDIGCSGLADIFFQTHAFHGLHGRALTYATGIKLARPELQVVVIMGDGGIGIGGAHFQAACRRNLDLTLLIFNNFNYGMTGGQYSVTTPGDAATASGFLNRLDAPLDICGLADAAGAPFIARSSALAEDLDTLISRAIGYNGFSVIDIQGICTGRFTRKNTLTPSILSERIAKSPAYDGPVACNERPEFGHAYQEQAVAQTMVKGPALIEEVSLSTKAKRSEVLILGRAGQRIGTAGEILALAGMVGGLTASQKIAHDITVLRGASISEVLLGPKSVGFTGIEHPDVVLALGREGVDRRRGIFTELKPDSLVIQAGGIAIPETSAQVRLIDFQKLHLAEPDWALAALILLAREEWVITVSSLKKAIAVRFQGMIRDNTLGLIEEISGGPRC